MNIEIAVALCKAFEGFRSKPYLCPAGIPTIGYGSTYYTDGRKVSLGDNPISQESAEDLLRHEISHTYLPGVLRLCPVLGTDENRCNAIIDFAYNLGLGRLQTSTLRKKINERKWDESKVELKKWSYGGGKVLSGLVKRREAEAALV